MVRRIVQEEEDDAGPSLWTLRRRRLAPPSTTPVARPPMVRLRQRQAWLDDGEEISLLARPRRFTPPDVPIPPPPVSLPWVWVFT